MVDTSKTQAMYQHKGEPKNECRSSRSPKGEKWLLIARIFEIRRLVEVKVITDILARVNVLFVARPRKVTG